MSDPVTIDLQCPITNGRCDRPCGTTCLRGALPTAGVDVLALIDGVLAAGTALGLGPRDCAHEAWDVDTAGQPVRCADCGAPLSAAPGDRACCGTSPQHPHKGLCPEVDESAGMTDPIAGMLFAALRQSADDHLPGVTSLGLRRVAANLDAFLRIPGNTAVLANALGLQLAPARPVAELTKKGRVRCTNCGGKTWRLEDQPTRWWRPVDGGGDRHNAERRLAFDGHYDVTDDGINEVITCDGCETEHEVPDGVQVDWT